MKPLGPADYLALLLVLIGTMTAFVWLLALAVQAIEGMMR